MTRKHYQLLANHVATAWQHQDINLEGIHCIADALESDNPRFDRDRFLEACGAAQENLS